MLAVLTTHPIQYQIPIWQELARRGEFSFEVWYLSVDNGFARGFAWDIDMLKGYPHRPLATRPSNVNINTFRGARIGSLAPLFEKQKVTALLINGWMPQAYWQAAFQAHRANIPVLLRGETNDLRRLPLWMEMLKRTLLRRLFKRISVFLTIGEANRRFYRKYGVSEGRMIPAPYCVDNKRFAEAVNRVSSQRSTLRTRWDIPQDAMCFLFCGKFISKKRVQDMMDAFEKLVLDKESQVACPTHLLLVGDGILRPLLEERADRLRKLAGKPCVTFAGFLNQTEIPKAYAAADCLVLPSDSEETWGLVVNEAMACGLPAIVSDQVGCGPDLIDPGSTGDFFPMGDVERLARAMAAWSDPARCARARMAVARKIADYSIEKAAAGIVDAFHAVCRKFDRVTPPATDVVAPEKSHVQ